MALRTGYCPHILAVMFLGAQEVIVLILSATVLTEVHVHVPLVMVFGHILSLGQSESHTLAAMFIGSMEMLMLMLNRDHTS